MLDVLGKLNPSLDYCSVYLLLLLLLLFFFGGGSKVVGLTLYISIHLGLKR